MLVKIDDDLIAQYQAANPDAAKLPIEQLLNRQLARFASAPLTGRTVVLTTTDLGHLELLFGGPQLTTAALVVARAQAYSQVKLGSVVIPLTSAEKEELAYRAKKQGKPVSELMRGLIDQLHDTLFNATVPVR